MPFAARELVLAAWLTGCASEPDPFTRDRAFSDLSDCVEIVTEGLQWLVEGDPDEFSRSHIQSRMDTCLHPSAPADVGRMLATEPHRSRFVRLLVGEHRQRALDVMEHIHMPAFRPFLGVADQKSLRVAVVMDDRELDRHPETIPPAWRAFIARVEPSKTAELILLDAFRDPPTACVDVPAGPEVRRELLRALRRVGGFGYLGHTLHRDPDPAIRREAVRLFGMQAAVKHAELREAAMTDPDLRVRATAYAALEDVRGVPVPAAYLRQR